MFSLVKLCNPEHTFLIAPGGGCGHVAEHGQAQTPPNAG
jgi:hypothetical protein